MSTEISALNLFVLTSGLYSFWWLKKKECVENGKTEEDRQKKERLEAYQNFLKLKESGKSDVVPSTDKNIRGTKIAVKLDEVYLWEVEHLSQFFESEGKDLDNVMHAVGSNSTFVKSRENAPLLTRSLADTATATDSTKTQYNAIMGAHECILVDLVRKPPKSGEDIQSSRALMRAGPRKELHFHPDTVNAAIVTCGGLCPGLNNVVREVTNSLFYLYNIKGKVYGIRGGYKGFYDPSLPPIVLTPETVENIHHSGGTVLTSSRGGFDLDKIITFLQTYKIKQLYVIGGDGTHRGAYRIHEGCLAAVSYLCTYYIILILYYINIDHGCRNINIFFIPVSFFNLLITFHFVFFFLF